MHARLLGIFLIFLLLEAGCTKQDGMIAGKVAPPGAAVRVAVMQNGNTIAATTVDPDGAFNIALAPGTYDINLSTPASPFPLVLQAIRVEPGKTTDLDRIELAQPKGNAALSGRIIPAGPETTVSLYGEGRERTVMHVDGEGRYQFTELTAGTYTLQVNAPAYAQDAVAIPVADEQAVTQNVRLLYASAADGVDWTAGKIRVTGIGLPPVNAATATVRREMARRAALVDGERKLVKTVAQIKVGPGQSLQSFWGEKNFTERIQGFIRGYKVVGEREADGGRIEIDLELPLTGQGGLSRHLFE